MPMDDSARSAVGYALDQLGGSAFELLTNDLIRELTGWSESGDGTYPSEPLERGDAPVVMRFPEFLGGQLWHGTIAKHRIYLPGMASGTENLVRVRDPIKASLTSYQQEKEIADKVKEMADSAAAENPQPGQARSAAAAFDLNPFASRQPFPGRQVPDYVIFYTNLSLTDVPDADLNELHATFNETAVRIGLQGWKLWDYSDYCAMLTAASRTRRKYIAQIAPRAILKVIPDYNVGVSGRLAEAVLVQAINELKADRLVRLPQTGDAEQPPLALSSVGIDLPLVSEATKAARLIIQASDDAGIKRRQGIAAPSILLLGGPGQGKSTITRLVSQAYRVAMLKHSLDPGQDTFPTNTAIERGLQGAGIPLPALRRWPVRVEMAHYVDDSINHSGKSLIKYIAERAQKSSDAMSTPLVRAWLRAWPWLLILDGFDEVASSQGRETLLEQLTNFMGEVQGMGADVFVLATTRPQGYAEEFAPHGYRKIALADLDTAQAAEYGLKVAKARHGEDPEMLDKVTSRLDLAANDALTARLMRSPLQVSIMSTLLETRERVPRARYELFDAYYKTIYARETGKPGPLAAMLDERSRHINELHNWLGLTLQANSEQAGELDASVPQDALRANAVERLRDEGHRPAKAEQLANQIVQAVTTRLVLIVPTKETDVGFDSRPLQEFFAARAIASGPDSSVLERLRVIAEPSHWRNTWQLAAGKVFSDRHHLRRQVISVLSDADIRDPLRSVVAPGADLALDLLGDNLANQSPGLQHNLYRQALSLLDYPPDADLRRHAPVLFTLAEHDPDLAFWLGTMIDRAEDGPLARLESIQVVLELADRSAKPLAFTLRPRLRRIERLIDGAREAAALSADLPTLGDALQPVLARAELSDADRRLANLLAAELAGMPVTWNPDPSEADAAVPRDLIEDCLSREPVARLLAEATVTALRLNSGAGARLRNMLKVWVQRQNVGREVLELTFPPASSR
jgi:ATPase family associated with various cellular activities (AAA)